MANGVGPSRLDQIREGLGLRGLGISRLTSQAIQRANLPTLQAEVAESRATQRNLQQRRLNEFRSRLLEQQDLTRGARGIGQQDATGEPLGVIRVRGTGTSGRPTRFELDLSATGVPERRTFRTINELQQFIRQNQLQGRVTSVGARSLEQPDLQRIAPTIPGPQARRILGVGAPRGLTAGLSALGIGRRFGGQQRPEQAVEPRRLTAQEQLGITQEQQETFARGQIRRLQREIDRLL